MHASSHRCLHAPVELASVADAWSVPRGAKARCAAGTLDTDARDRRLFASVRVPEASAGRTTRRAEPNSKSNRALSNQSPSFDMII